jgi:hypothetical protein
VLPEAPACPSHDVQALGNGRRGSRGDVRVEHDEGDPALQEPSWCHMGEVAKGEAWRRSGITVGLPSDCGLG